MDMCFACFFAVFPVFQATATFSESQHKSTPIYIVVGGSSPEMDHSTFEGLGFFIS